MIKEAREEDVKKEEPKPPKKQSRCWSTQILVKKSWRQGCLASMDRGAMDGSMFKISGQLVNLMDVWVPKLHLVSCVAPLGSGGRAGGGDFIVESNNLEVRNFCIACMTFATGRWSDLGEFSALCQDAYITRTTVATPESPM